MCRSGTSIKVKGWVGVSGQRVPYSAEELRVRCPRSSGRGELVWTSLADSEALERIRLVEVGVTLQPRQSAFQTDAPSERATLRPPSWPFPQIFIAIAVITSLFVLFELMRYHGMVRLDKVELTQLKREASYFNGKPEGDKQCEVDHDL